MNIPHVNRPGRSAAARPAQMPARKAATTGTLPAVIASVRKREVKPEERRQMIAEAAYYRAERRGFHGGSDLEDWLESEAAIDKLLLHG